MKIYNRNSAHSNKYYEKFRIKQLRIHYSLTWLFTQHITPVLRQLDWLPVEYRVKFKILILTFKVLHGKISSYVRHVTLDQTRQCLCPYSGKASHQKC